MCKSNNLERYVLCKGRHEVIANDGQHVTESIFGNEVDPLDVRGLQEIAEEFLRYKPYEIEVYVTGLSVALVALINASVAMEKSLWLMHFDRNSSSYYPQGVAKPYDS